MEETNYIPFHLIARWEPCRNELIGPENPNGLQPMIRIHLRNGERWITKEDICLNKLQGIEGRFVKEYAKCNIRKDILSRKERVPVGEWYVGFGGPFTYRWTEKDEFQILYKGNWCGAQSIDFEF